MTYAEFMKGFIRTTGVLESYGGSWNFAQREGGRDVISAVHDGFVIVSRAGTVSSPENSICTIPLTLFTFNSKKPRGAGFL
jgi:hypothetical protein